MKITDLRKENIDEFLTQLRERGRRDNSREEEAVKAILEDVRINGDAALFSYMKKFDGADIDSSNILVTEEEFEEALKETDERFKEIISKAAERIRAFHENEKRKSWFITEEDGSILGQRIIPLETAGLYVPGGKAAYPSSVLMNIIPAKVAGVKNIIVATPCGKDGKVSPYTLVAARYAGADRVYKMGGAQAVAAMAFGTETVPKTDKITGPGNIFVALAKKNVYGQVSIDSVAGPSEITVLADDTADPEYIAADLLSQAEHDEMASSILVTCSEKLAGSVLSSVEKMTESLERRDIISRSLEDNGRIIIARDITEAVETVNSIASEHLEIVTEDPFGLLPKIRNAGAVFLGSYSSEPLGDYMAGPNHVLPTGGTARFFSPLSVDDFIKKQSMIYFEKEALSKLHEDIEEFAKREGLTAHANSIKVRFTEDGNENS